MNLRHANLLAPLAAIAPVTCAPALAQDDNPSSWRRALERFERDLDEYLEDLTASAQAQNVTGMLVPGAPGPEGARELPAFWTPLASLEHPPRKLVLLVHGLDEPGDIWCDLAPALVEAGHEIARFDYANDQRIRVSTEQLLVGLREARGAGVEEIALIGHSMGGLVAFDALTRPDGYAGDPAGSPDLPRVSRFIAVGTPWKGSPWARMRAAAEVREQVQRWLMSKSWNISPILDYRRDGMGQAGDDLAPGSEVLADLASREFPPGLPLTVIAGEIAPAGSLDLTWLAESTILRELLGSEDLASLVADLREAGEMLGDGAVPLESALAREAPDTHVFKVNHRALIRVSPLDFVTGSDPAGPPGIPVILERLAADADPDGAP